MPGWKAWLLLAAMFGLAGEAAAQPGQAQPSQAQAGAIRQACRADYGSHCAGVPTGGQAALACLQRNMASLSPPCRDAVGAVGGGAAAAPPPASRPVPHETEAALRERCMADARQHCRGVMPGGGRMLGCLADNREALSAECREAMMGMRERMR